MSEAQSGKKASIETKRKMSKAHNGFRHTSESKKKMSLAQSGENHPMWGKHHSEEAKRKISIGIGGKNHYNYGKKGKDTTGWKEPSDRKSVLASRIRGAEEYKIWRMAIFSRDKYLCTNCDVKGAYLNADYIKPFSLIIKENKITTLEEALECTELWDLENGRTLCVPCHKLTDTYGGRCVKFLS